MLYHARYYRSVGYGVLFSDGLCRLFLSPRLSTTASSIQPLLFAVVLVVLLLVLGCVRRVELTHWAVRSPRLALMAVHAVEAAVVTALLLSFPLPSWSLLAYATALLLANLAQGGWRFLLLAIVSASTAACFVVTPHLLEHFLAGLSAPQDLLAGALGSEGPPRSEVPWLLPALNALPVLLVLAFALAFVGLGSARVQRLRAQRRHQRHHLEAMQRRTAWLTDYLPVPLRARLDESHVHPHPPETRRERCWFAVGFVDLCGFTALAQQLDAESLGMVLDDFLATAHTLVAAEGGVTAKVLGDGLLLCWPEPRGAEPGDRALRAAAALRFSGALNRSMPAVCDRARQRGEPLRLAVRSALTAGYCMVGDWGRQTTGSSGAKGPVEHGLVEYTLIGDPVNRAARLQQRAQPAGVVVDDAIATLLTGEAFSEPVVADLPGLGPTRYRHWTTDCQRNLTVVR
ncbi:MAG: adenylate/guanylate cyclase domain-containing protein [Pseudomonadota bacterium]